MANLFAKVVAAIAQYPDKNAVDAYANGVNWREYKPVDGTRKMLVANRIYIGKLAKLYDYVLIGSNGTNDRFSIAIFRDFDPQAFKDGLKGVFSVKAKPSNTSKSSAGMVNKKFEVYDLLDGEKQVGLLVMTYCTADSIDGSGTVGFISEAYANKKGFLIPQVNCRLK